MRKQLILLTASALILSGCSAAAVSSESAPTSDVPAISEAPPALAVSVAPPPPPPIPEPVAVSVKPEIKGSGTMEYEESAERMNAEQERLLLDYMDMYYQSLGGLKAKDPSAFFAEEAETQALSRQSAWQVVVDVRKAQAADLSLTAFSYTLTATDVSAEDNGDVGVFAREYASQSFAAFPGTESETFNTYHRFTMKQTAEGWRLTSHMQMDSANMVALGRSMFRRNSESAGYEDMEAQLTEQRANVLAAHRTNIAERASQRSAYDSAAPATMQAPHGYNREAAVAYALEWVGKRNTQDWQTYDRMGGNCANFTSQAILAGGIPMDYSGSSQWKWYGDTPSTAQAPSGRSGAWSGVNEFYTYVTNNSGYGMVAEAEANFWSGEPGDVIQLGYEDNWRHVVMITEVISDEDGKPIDYLICSNTADQRNYPISAYMYPQQRLIKIHGWQE